MVINATYKKGQINCPCWVPAYITTPIYISLNTETVIFELEKNKKYPVKTVRQNRRYSVITEINIIALYAINPQRES